MARAERTAEIKHVFTTQGGLSAVQSSPFSDLPRGISMSLRDGLRQARDVMSSAER